MDSSGLNRFSEIKLSPYTIVNSAFLLVAPFLSWITLNVFGLYESNLWQISMYQIPMSIPRQLAVASLITGILLMGGGILGLKSIRPALLIQATGLILFLATSYSLFGYVHSGVIVVLISPGTGLILASVGIAIGLLSIRTEKVPLEEFYARFWTREGLYRSGLFVALTSFLVDVLNHVALGEASGFFGTTFLEEFIHLGFLLPLLFLVISYSLGVGLSKSVWPSRIPGLIFLFLGFDAAYHALQGSLFSFLGHTPEEVLIHFAAYCGVAFLLISSNLMRR